jgi:hypothetical protein
MGRKRGAATAAADDTVVGLSRLSQVTGWSPYQVRKHVAEGMPVRQLPATRGGDWRFSLDDVLAWADARGVGRKAVPLPPGWGLVERLDKPFEKGFAAGVLAVAYGLERTVAGRAVDEGVPIGAAYRIASVSLLVTLVAVGSEAARWGLEPWASAEDPGTGADLGLAGEAFTHVNWPALARRAGEPGWTPPAYHTAWLELSAERREACLRHADAEDAASAAEAAAEAAGHGAAA